MAELTMPSSGVRTVSFGMRRNVKKIKSQFTGSTQEIARPGDIWFATYEIAIGTQAMRAEWQVFLMQAGNVSNTFKAYNHYYSARGALGGTPLVNGADQTGISLVTDGWPNSTSVLKAGDFITVNDELKIVTSDVTSDGSGNATIAIEPKIRVSPDDNSAITTVNPYCLMRLTDNEQAQWEVDEAGHYRIVFTAEEQFYNAP